MISSAYWSTTDSAMSAAISTGISFPSTSLRFSLTASSLLQSVHLTRSFPWQTQPRFAHSISLTLSGLGVQSVSSWNVANRRTSWSRSPGQYLGGCNFVTGLSPFAFAFPPLLPGPVWEFHFLRVTFEMVVCPFVGVVNVIALGVEGSPPTRRFLLR